MKLTDNEKRDIIKLLPFLQAIEITNDWQSVGMTGSRLMNWSDSSGDLLGGGLLPIKIALKK